MGNYRHFFKCLFTTSALRNGAVDSYDLAVEGVWGYG